MRKLLLPTLAWSALALAGCLPDGGAEAQTWRTMTSARQVWEEEPLAVQLQYGAGTLTVGAADAPMMYQMEIRYDEDTVTPLVEFDPADHSLRLGVRSLEMNRRSFNRREGSTATINLTRTLPLDLDLNFGAGQANIHLGGISIRRLSVSTGASETTVSFDSPNPVAAERIAIEAGAADLRVTGLGNARAERITFQGGVGSTVLDFGGSWDRNGSASVQMGVGSVTLRIPRGLGLRINRSSFLTSFSPRGLERQGNDYFSADWASAPYRLTIDIQAALGSIDVQWIE